MSRILLVEDDKSLGQTLCERLVKEGHEVELVETTTAAKSLFREKSFDLAVFDVGLPDGSGFELAERIRAEKGIPFVFMTAASDAENRLAGFELGAEEFIPKPFHLKEFLIRVQHVLDNHTSSNIIRVENSEINFETMTISVSGRAKTLAARECQTLKYLVEMSPKVVSREEILDKVWGEDKFPSNRTVDNLIVKLRQLLESPSNEWLRSVRGVGYQWANPR